MGITFIFYEIVVRNEPFLPSFVQQIIFEYYFCEIVPNRLHVNEILPTQVITYLYLMSRLCFYAVDCKCNNNTRYY